MFKRKATPQSTSSKFPHTVSYELDINLNEPSFTY